MRQTIINILRNLGLNQRRCGNCHSPFFPDGAVRAAYSPLLCPDCAKILAPSAGRRCRSCGNSLPEQDGDGHFQEKRQPGLCQKCRNAPPPWRAIGFYGLYADSLREMLLRFKFDSQLNLRLILGDFLFQASNCLPRPDFLTAIPQHPERLVRRGYNQAHELARILSRKTGFPLAPQMLKRVRPGVPQEGLSATERELNLKNAFWAHPAVSQHHLWLIDDVMTTGSTFTEATNTLLTAGAASVSLLFVARTAI